MRTETQTPLLESDYYVEGYAATFDRYKLYDDWDGQPVYEQFKAADFAGCDMSDIIFQFNHRGMVFARLRNNSLIVKVDEKGLFIAADLGRTTAAREMYEAIKCGNIDRMSWGFVPKKTLFNPETSTITYNGIKKIYDVSAVDLPANEDTIIEARRFVDGEISRIKQELEKREIERLKLEILLTIAKG
jgi:HK97 family phage prohead protease